MVVFCWFALPGERGEGGERDGRDFGGDAGTYFLSDERTMTTKMKMKMKRKMA